VKRREFITLLGGAASLPLAVRAQQSPQQRRVGVLMETSEGNSDGQTRIAAFRHGLQELGWTEGRSIWIDVRWGGGDVERIAAHAAELVALKPDVLFTFANAQLGPLSRATHTIPIVFVGASDPVGGGYVTSFARPGGNITGFTNFEPAMGGKWLELLKAVAPSVARVATMFNPDTATLRGEFYVKPIESAAAAFAVGVVTIPVHSIGDIEAAIAALGQRPDSGLIVAPDTFTSAHREHIITLTGRDRVPAVYGFREWPMAGGLMSYGPDQVDTTRRASGYVDRILKGEKPADLPVQAPTKFELLINLKAAKALGLTVPQTLLALADEVIE